MARAKSTKTTWGGVIALMGAVALILGKTLFADGESLSPTDIEVILELVGLGGVGLGTAVTGLFGRDHNVSSEGHKIVEK